MMSHKVKIKGYKGKKPQGKPFVDLKMDTQFMSLVDVEVILESIRAPYIEIGEFVSFKIYMEDLDYDV